MESKNLIEVKEKIKKDLINYYDIVKFQIDIDIQETLIKQVSDITDNLKYELVEINKKLIDKVDSNCNHSMNEINNYFDSLNQLNTLFSNMDDLNSFLLDDEEMIPENQNQSVNFAKNNLLNESINKSIDETSIKMTALNKYCLYISKAKINTIFHNRNILHGILISFDWYPSENQLNYIK